MLAESLALILLGLTFWGFGFLHALQNYLRRQCCQGLQCSRHASLLTATVVGDFWLAQAV